MHPSTTTAGARNTVRSVFGAAWRSAEIAFTAITGLLFWLYAVFLLFTWYGARLTPEPLVLIRIAASILSDLVWIPFGFIVWSGVLTWFSDGILKRKGSFIRLLGRAAVYAAITIFFINSLETAFAFLFIPLPLYGIRLLFAVKNHRTPKLAFIGYLPLILIMASTAVYYRWQLVPSMTTTGRPDDIRVMGYNIFAYAGYDDRMKVFETIRNESPDIVCIMEFNPMSDPGLFRKELGDRYPYMLVGDDLSRWTQSAAFILSRYPVRIIPAEKVSEKLERYVNFIFAEVDVNGRKVNIVNYHLITVGHRVARAAREKLRSDEPFDDVAGKEAVIDSEKYGQVLYLLDKISTFREPTILCGDLNDTPNSRAYHLLDRHFVNTFSEKGWGLGATFGKVWMQTRLGFIPGMGRIARNVMRIDHIFVSRDFTVVSTKVIGDAEGSDHTPVIAELRLNGEMPQRHEGAKIKEK